MALAKHVILSTVINIRVIFRERYAEVIYKRPNTFFVISYSSPTFKEGQTPSEVNMHMVTNL